MKVIINKQTKRIESEEDFKNRFRSNVSFGPVLNAKTVEMLDKEGILVDVGNQPTFNDSFQRCVLREPWEVDGKLTTAWAVENKSTHDTNQVYNTAIEAFIDSKARGLLYANQDRMVSYIGSKDPKTDREARYMQSWRDKVWITANFEIAQAFKATEENPLKPLPAPDFIIAKLPKFEVPENF